VGAALAEIALRDRTPRARRLFLAAGVLASNLPDLDLVYTGVTPEPLGYLLHHRGHTHTVVGLVAQALVIAAVCLAPPLRRAIRDAGGPFFTLIGVSLALHVVLDSWNTYGVHAFWPVDSRWYYGDAVFIFEPWLWLLLGTAAAANARSRLGRAAVALAVAALSIALAAIRILPAPALVALVATGAVLAWLTRGMTARARSVSALASSAVLIVGLFGLSALARGRTRAALGPDREVLDVIVNPNPGWPVCWAVIAVEKDIAAGDLVLRRGTLSLLPAWHPPARCPSQRLEAAGDATARGALAWDDDLRQPLARLRGLAERDCWVRAWLQFGRAPFVRDGTIADLRFHSRNRGNFTAMDVSGAERSCPPAMTGWGMPRADVLSVPAY
jgi:inner membrane protein